MLTAAQIHEALVNALPEERLALASQLIALALANDDATIDEPVPDLDEDRDELIAHLHDKRRR